MKPALSLIDPANDALSSFEPAGQAKSVSHRSPARPEKTWQWTATDEAAAEQAATRARLALPKWRAVRATERFQLLQSFGEALKGNGDEMIELLVEEIGKPIRYARGELARSLALIQAAEQQIDRSQDKAPDQTGYRREPLGVVALITPFNNPLAIPIGKIVPALLYGNVVLWKPAIAGSAIAARVVELFKNAAGRDDLLQSLFGNEESARQVMNAGDAVTISGSQRAGRAAQEICSTRSLPLQAELGGNNAAIVWNDADVREAAAKIAEGAFGFAGQRCTANRRVIIDPEIYDRFIEALLDAARGLRLGDPADEETRIGPLVSALSRERVARVICEAEKTPLRVLQPVEKSQTPKGDSYLPPAIVFCDDPAHEIVQEETFGPVLVVQRARNWTDAISLCNGVRQGLAAALFSGSAKLIEDFLRRAKAGILKINCSTADAAVDLPFGGWKASGIGPPEHGPANCEFFTRMQAIYFS